MFRSEDKPTVIAKYNFVVAFIMASHGMKRVHDSKHEYGHMTLHRTVFYDERTRHYTVLNMNVYASYAEYREASFSAEAIEDKQEV